MSNNPWNRRQFMRIGAGLGLCLVLILALVRPGVAVAEPQIVWQVENPFRFFLDPADTLPAMQRRDGHRQLSGQIRQPPFVGL